MYDITVIGGGPGGYRSAELLGRKHRVALIEENHLGGICLNQGCIPFKSYLHFSRIRSEVMRASSQHLIESSDCRIDQETVLENKNRIVRGLQQGIASGLKASGADIIYGTAVKAEEKDGCFFVQVGDQQIESKKIIIATGSEETLLPAGQNSSSVVYSKDMLEMNDLPDDIIIIGGGVIGLEAACYYCDAGCQVTILEMQDHIGGNMDREISDSLCKVLAKKGIRIITNAAVKQIENNRVLYSLEKEDLEIQAQIILCAIGRKPRLQKELLDPLGVEYNSKGVCIDDKCRTTNPNVFACGDVTGKVMLAHTAYRQAKVIADHIDGMASAMDYHIIPHVMYTNPEVLSVGYTEEDCKALNLNYRACSLPMTYSGKYYAENGKDGAKAKMLINDMTKVIGLHIIGNGMSEFALAAELMIAKGMTVEEISNLVYPHPTYCEIVAEMASKI